MKIKSNIHYLKNRKDYSYLATIQYSINRMGSTSIAIKSICITIVIGFAAALFGINFLNLDFFNKLNCINPNYQYISIVQYKSYVIISCCIFLIIGTIAIIAMAILDAYYLSLERGYINLYKIQTKPFSCVSKFYFAPFTCKKDRNDEKNIEKENFFKTMKTLGFMEKDSNATNYFELHCIKNTKILKCLRSVSVWVFYSIVFVINLIIPIYLMVFICFI